MVRGVFRRTILGASLALFSSFELQTNIAQAHGPGGTCDGSCQSQGANSFAPNSQTQAYQPSYIQQQAYQQPITQSPSGYYGQGPRTFAGSNAHDCPICRAEREQGLAAGPNNMSGPNNFAGVPSNYDSSMDRPRLTPMPSRQAGYPMSDPYARGTRPAMPRGFQAPMPGNPIPVEPMIAGQDRGMMPTGIAAQQSAIPDGMALVLQNDSPLMNGNDQLGSIDRGQTLRVLNIQGNWVQLETDWLGKNTWIRKNQVRMNDNIQPPNDIAPPAT